MPKPFLPSILDLRKIDWSNVSSWDIKFEESPAPFNNWFPASKVDMDLSSIKDQSIEGAMLSTGVPSGSEDHKIALTFYDNAEGVLERWIEEWMASIINNGYSVLTVEEASRTCYIIRTNSKQEIVEYRGFKVFPIGKLISSYTSDSSVKEITQEFTISGRFGGARTALNTSV